MAIKIPYASAKDVKIHVPKFIGYNGKVAHDENVNTMNTWEMNQWATSVNAQEAEKARQWETEMSNSAHQREVIDLKKAGLNPVLSVNSGATSYSTQSAQSVANNNEGANVSASVSKYNTDKSAQVSQQNAPLNPCLLRSIYKLFLYSKNRKSSAIHRH